MSDKGDHKTDGFSPELMHAISAGEVNCFVDLPVVSQSDVAVLKQILRGEKSPSTPIDKKRAVNALAQSEKSAEASEILARILSDTKETTRVRAAAAVQLSIMPQQVAERALVANLTTDNEIVRTEVLKSLGRVGTATALDHLRKLPAPKTEYARQQLSLAKLAISFRIGDENAKDETTSHQLRWTTQEARVIEGDRVRKTIEAIQGSTYEIPLNPDIAFEIDCGRTKLTLLLNNAIKRGAFTEAILSRKMIAGLVVAEESETRHFSVRYLVMTSPSEKGVEVTVTRTDGDVTYAGEVRRDGNDLHLTIRDVGVERIATEIEGKISNAGIQLNIRVLQGSTRSKKRAVPIRV